VVRCCAIGAILALLGFAGCESLTPPVSLGEAGAFATEDSDAPATPVVAEPEPLRDALTLAAECLGRGDHANAAIHLETHVREHPDQFMFRLQLAELLLRVGREQTARIHFEQFAADGRRATASPVAKKQLVSVHTRLMEIAQRNDDRYGEVFHRGVGLLLLTAEQDGMPDRDEGFCEEMLCKSLRALKEAKERNPDAAEVRFWLAKAYERMGNRRAAEAERNTAKSSVTPTGLGPMLPRRE
jgi:thioredoxin-like negative regulator of GroEL